VRAYEQRRINNRSKCSNCYGPHAFGGPAVLCVKFVLYHIQGYIQSKNLDIQGKLSEREPLYFTHDAETLFAESEFARNLWQAYGLLQRLLNVALEQCSSTFLSSWNPDILSCLSVNPHQQKCKKTRITCKKIKHFVLDISTNKQLLQKVKSKKFNDLINWCCSCISGTYLLHSEFYKKDPYLKYVSFHFLTLAI